MALEIQLLHENNTVNIIHTGKLDKDEMNTGKDDSLSKLLFYNWNKILLDLSDAELQLQGIDIALVFKKLNHSHPTGVFLAAVQPAKTDFDYCQFAKTISVECSNYTIEVFIDRTSALEWLVKQ